MPRNFGGFRKSKRLRERLVDIMTVACMKEKENTGSRYTGIGNSLSRTVRREKLGSKRLLEEKFQAISMVEDKEINHVISTNR